MIWVAMTFIGIEETSVTLQKRDCNLSLTPASVAVVMVARFRASGFHYPLPATHVVSKEKPTMQHDLSSSCVLFV